MNLSEIDSLPSKLMALMTIIRRDSVIFSPNEVLIHWKFSPIDGQRGFKFYNMDFEYSDSIEEDIIYVYYNKYDSLHIIPKITPGEFNEDSDEIIHPRINIIKSIDGPEKEEYKKNLCGYIELINDL